STRFGRRGRERAQKVAARARATATSKAAATVRRRLPAEPVAAAGASEPDISGLGIAAAGGSRSRLRFFGRVTRRFYARVRATLHKQNGPGAVWPRGRSNERSALEAEPSAETQDPRRQHVGCVVEGAAVRLAVAAQDRPGVERVEQVSRELEARA